MSRFSLVAEIWGLASLRNNHPSQDLRRVSVSLPRFGGWRVAVLPRSPTPNLCFSLVAEIWGLARTPNSWAILRCESFSLVAEIWGLARSSLICSGQFFAGFSLVAEIWGLASTGEAIVAGTLASFQSRCRDLGVGETWPSAQAAALA